METKVCGKCNKEKVVDEFYVERTKMDGSTLYRRICKECDKKRSKDNAGKNLPKKRETARKYYKNIRLAALAQYSNGKIKCGCCGEPRMEFLTIDHVDGDGAKHRREIGKTRAIFNWLKKNKYPDGFQVLCYNCNCAKGQYKECPHVAERRHVNYGKRRYTSNLYSPF